jgi:hypothetical protein
MSPWPSQKQRDHRSCVRQEEGEAGLEEEEREGVPPPFPLVRRTERPFVSFHLRTQVLQRLPCPYSRSSVPHPWGDPEVTPM